MLACHARSLLLPLVLLLSAGVAGAAEPADVGSVVGRVFDSVSSESLDGVAVTLHGPVGPDATAKTNAEGSFELGQVPAGRYEVRFEKAGYRPSTMTDFEVKAGQPNRADFPLPPLPAAAAEEPTDVEEFVIVASPVAEILAASRMDADELINTLSAAELDKFAVGDVADALKFVPGVNVVKGQFAVIRGLEDRYSSTLYNSAPVPSPDPDRQSVQLDLFPSDIVSDIVVAKTFGPDLPGNSSAGSINILTHSYPEEMEFKITGGGGFNANAWRNFLDFESGNPVGQKTSGWDTLESDYGAVIGGRTEALDREIRFKAIINNEVDYDTRDGFQQERQPKRCRNSAISVCQPGPAAPGDLALGVLSLSGGKYDLTESNRSEQLAAYGGLGFDIDEAANHKIDGSIFYTTFDDDVVQLKDNGFLPNFDYGQLAETQANGEEILPQAFDGFATFNSQLRRVRPFPSSSPAQGALWFSSFLQSKSFETTRDLLVYQLNGDHTVETIDGLHITWAANHAKTTEDNKSLGMNYFFEPDDDTQTPPTQFPVGVHDLGPGQFATNGGLSQSANHVNETQNFGRLDAEYRKDLSDSIEVTLSTGGWYEDADRNVNANFLENPSFGGTTQFVTGDTQQDLGRNAFDQVVGSLRESTNDSTRRITAWDAGAKTTIWENYDLLAGFRLENILIESNNDPFIEGVLDFSGTPAIFPSKWLLFDRLDNAARSECPCLTSSFNDEILGIKVPIDPNTGLVDLTDEASIRSLINGRINQHEFLPTLGTAYRPFSGMSVRAAWSKTIARPSFREMGYYVTAEPGTDDLTIGNPQLGLSKVESYDLRAEYLRGEYGDIGAVSLFYKTIQDPIESIVLRDPTNFEAQTSALYRTFFNNPNTARLKGVEIEARKSFDFIPYEGMEYLSIGGNFTYIYARVDRTKAELERSVPFFEPPAGEETPFKKLSSSRRLYGQPEWIANADISFQQPDWGSKATLAFFAISSVLDAAGSAFIQPNGIPRDFVLDRYVDSFYQLDLVLSQEIVKGLIFKTSIKNLTDSRRRIIYDPYQTKEDIPERSWRIGQDYSFSLSYTYTF